MSGTASRHHRLQRLLKKGLKHHREGHIELAEACYRKMLKVDPTCSEAHCHLGEAHEQLGDLEAAAASYRRAVALKPDSPDLYCQLARVLYRGGALQPAAELYKRALALNPKSYEIYNDLGLLLTDMGNFGAAIEAFRRALILKPGSAKTIASVGYHFECKGDLISAVEAYRDALKLDPKLLPAYGDLGFILYGLGEVAEAEDCYHRLRVLQPDSAEATANLGLIHLLQGKLALGWREYESRWMVGVGDERKLVQPRWTGEPLGGARILLYAEQGLGDTMQFVRFVPLVAAREGQIVLEVQPELRRLLSGTKGASQIISRGETLPEFAWQCPLLSLPLAFATELDTIPATVPYINLEPAQVEAWRLRLQGDTRRIGLAWGGNPKHRRDRLRSIPLEQLLPLMKIEGTTFYSLQLGFGVEQVKQMPPGTHLIDLSAELKDLADTAAIVANLDLVITVDSSVAHLAGALGKPVWILLNKGSDWRWFLEREDSPWYPTARLFRQSTPEGWQEVVSRVELELRRV